MEPEKEVETTKEDSNSNINKQANAESTNVVTTFKPWRPWEVKEKCQPAVAERCKPVFNEEESVGFSPAVNNTVMNTPAVCNSTPAVAARKVAGRGGCKPAAARSVFHTPAGVDLCHSPAVSCGPYRTPGRRRGSPSKRRSLLLYHQRKVEQEGLGPSWLQLATAAWQEQPYGLMGGWVGNVQGSWGAAGGLGAQGYQNLLSTEYQSIQQNICGAMSNPVLAF